MGDPPEVQEVEVGWEKRDALIIEFDRFFLHCTSAVKLCHDVKILFCSILFLLLVFYYGFPVKEFDNKQVREGFK